MSATRALIVGCNYPGTEVALPSPVLDCESMRTLLETSMGVPAENINVLVDDGEGAVEEALPTKDNIEARLQQLIAESQPGDHLLFYFSGHGTQVPSDDAEEADSYDEAICPTDFTNVITDDDLRQVLSELPAGVSFTMISDSCHSGTLLDHAEVVIEGPKEDDPAEPEGMKDGFAEKCAGHAADSALTKSMDICGHLSKSLGTEVGPGNIRYALAVANGRNCSAKFRGIWDIIDQLGLGDLDPLEILNSLMEQAQPESVPKAGVKCADSVCPENAILISGCSCDQVSIDTGAGSALTLALVDVVQKFTEAYPDEALSLRSLVHYVREILLVNDLSQNPSLECTQEAADLPFLGKAAGDMAATKGRGCDGGGGFSAAGIDLDALMNQINYYRARHQVEPASWDEGLASQAQAWTDYLASTGQMQHGGHDGAGQNLFMMSGPMDINDACRRATDMWYEEVNMYDYNRAEFTMETGHFTQVVWRGSTRVGYAMSIGPAGTFLAAHYVEPGNMMGAFRDNVFPPV